MFLSPPDSEMFGFSSCSPMRSPHPARALMSQHCSGQMEGAEQCLSEAGTPIFRGDNHPAVVYYKE